MNVERKLLAEFSGGIAASVALRAIAFAATVFALPLSAQDRLEILITDLGPHAQAGWMACDYETTDGIKGTMPYAPWGRHEKTSVEIPLPAKGSYRIDLGLAGTRYPLSEASFAINVRLGRETAPVTLDSVAPSSDAGWWFQPVECTWKHAALDGDTLVVSALTFSTLAYVLGKALGADAAFELIEDFRKAISVSPVTEHSVDWAISSRARDFEDAMQYESALSANADVIVTRDPDGFAGSKIRVVSPSKFLKEVA